jgi:hypothetical protein
MKIKGKRKSVQELIKEMEYEPRTPSETLLAFPDYPSTISIPPLISTGYRW